MSENKRNKRKSPGADTPSIEEAAKDDDATVWENFTTDSLNDFLFQQRRHHEQQSHRSEYVGGQDPRERVPDLQPLVGELSQARDLYSDPSRQGMLGLYNSRPIGSMDMDSSFRRHTAERRASYGPSLTREEADRLIQYEMALTPVDSRRTASFDQSLPPPPPIDPLLQCQEYSDMPISRPIGGSREMLPGISPQFQLPQDPQPGRIHQEMGFASLPVPSDHWLLRSRNLSVGPDSSQPSQFIPSQQQQQQQQQQHQLSSHTNYPQTSAFLPRRRVEDNWTTVKSRSSQFQNNGQGYVIPMAVDSDRAALTLYQAIVRQSLEYFTAVDDDVSTTVQGRRKKILANQVGIRCRYCGHIPVRGRARAAVYYPRSLMNLYQGAQNIASVHFQTCTEFPAELLENLTNERPRKVFSKAGRRYWVDACQAIGVYEDDNALWYLPPDQLGSGKQAEAFGDQKPPAHQGLAPG